MQIEKKQVLDLLYDRPALLGRWVGFKDLTDLHNDWLKDFLYRRDDQTLLAHRGSYKTSVLSLFLAIHAVIAPNENVLFFRKTDDDVAEVIRQTQKILQSGALGRICFLLYGRPLALTTASTGEIDTSLHTSLSGASQIVGLGIGTSITGKHADIVVTDDIVNIKDRISPAERKRTCLQYMELQNIKNRSGRFINTGTPWHKEDAISLMPNVKRFDCYHTGLITPEKLAQLRSTMTDSLFAANYELKHIADEGALFRSPQFTDEETAVCDGLSHVDAAYGGADYTAFTVLKKTADGFVGYGRLWQKHVDDCIGEIEADRTRLRAGSLYCETNGDKGYLLKELRSRGIQARGYHENMNKYVKISTHLKKHWAKIKWLSGTDPEYINQILDYTENAAHDDAPDSAASLLREMEGGSRINVLHGGL